MNFKWSFSICLIDGSFWETINTTAVTNRNIKLRREERNTKRIVWAGLEPCRKRLLAQGSSVLHLQQPRLGLGEMQRRTMKQGATKTKWDGEGKRGDCWSWFLASLMLSSCCTGWNGEHAENIWLWNISAAPCHRLQRKESGNVLPHARCSLTLLQLLKSPCFWEGLYHHKGRDMHPNNHIDTGNISEIK